MDQNYGYHPLNKEPYGISHIAPSLFVSCCGQDVLRYRKFSQARPTGRLDYYFLFVTEGYIEVHVENRSFHLEKGHCCCIPPYVPHEIRYPATEHIEVYWTHFSGVLAPTYYEKIFDESPLVTIPMSVTIQPTVTLEKMITELQLQDDGYEEACSSLFTLFFTQLRRSLTNKKRDPLIQDLLLYMHRHLGTIKTVDDMACHVNLSTSRLIHRFTQAMETAPMTYLIKLRMERAVHLLSTSDLSIKEIADKVGYNNPLYFSNGFKKYYGESPSSYRKNIGTKGLPRIY